jgi:hypothetical protein
MQNDVTSQDSIQRIEYGENFISRLASEEVVKLIESAIKLGANELATARTRKYLMSPESEWNQRVKDYAQSIVSLSTQVGSSTAVDGVIYNLNEYQVPKKIKSFIDAGRVYLCQDAIGKGVPCFGLGIAQITMSPSVFNNFITEFSRNQDSPIETVPYSREFVSLDYVQYVEDEKGSMVRVHETGFDLETCSLLGFRVPQITGYSRSYTPASAREIGLWLLHS